MMDYGHVAVVIGCCISCWTPVYQMAIRWCGGGEWLSLDELSLSLLLTS